jgi:hypothetical protein
MKLIASVFSWIIAQLGLSLICYLMYNFFLDDLFKIEIEYLQWVSIIVISACIIPSGKILRANSGSKENVTKEATNPLEKYLSNFKNER